MKAAKLLEAVLYVLDMAIPRFVDDEVALELVDEDEYYPVCRLKYVEPDERFDGICTIRVFNLFGFALFPKLIGDVRPFVNPHDEEIAE